MNVAVAMILGVSHQDHAVSSGDLDAVAALRPEKLDLRQSVILVAI
jgi:hypothetical protein